MPKLVKFLGIASFASKIDNIDVPEADEDFNLDSYDHYLDLKLDSGSSEHTQLARVMKRLKDHCGNPIGIGNINPVLDTRMYEIEFAGGHKQALSANMIAESMFVSINEEGHCHLLLDSIIDFRKTKEAIGKKKMHLCFRLMETKEEEKQLKAIR